MTLKKIKFLLGFAITGCLILSCATSPLGRKQLMLLPESQMAEMGVQAFSEMKQKTPIERNEKINSYVNCVVQPILSITGSVEGVNRWEVVVFRSDDVNAFALPGGKIGVYTGLFKAAKTPSQLAAVLGHEVGHVIAKHGNERMSDVLGIQILQMGAGEVFQMDKNKRLALAALGMVGTLAFSRTQESESDLIGLDLMSRAGFDPEESVYLWQNMGQMGGGRPPEILSTHPANETRIRDLRANIPDALRKYNARKNRGALPNCVMP